MRKVLIGFGILIGVLLLGLGIGYLIVNEPLPEGEAGPRAEQAADRMLESMHYDQYQKAKLIEFRFMDQHHYTWHKKDKRVIAEWDEMKVDFNTQSKEGQAWEKGERLGGKAKEKAIQKAWKYWANDSFWLVNFYKIKDPGTKQEMLAPEDKMRKGFKLKVTYSSGGVTPGDSYVYTCNEKGGPKKIKMWVSILPVGGVEVEIYKWKKFHGFWLPLKYKGPMGFDIELDVRRVEMEEGKDIGNAGQN